MKDKIKVAKVWTDALANPDKEQIAVVADVLADDIVTGSGKGKQEVLSSLRKWQFGPMFAGGTWGKPQVKGDVVTSTCRFAPDAQYHEATSSVTVNREGLISKVSTVIRAAAPPLGDVIDRVWGPRRGLDGLSAHLEDEYSIKVSEVKQLDNGVLRVDRSDGPSWVARVFPADRRHTSIKGDAAVLKFLEKNDYPAERCANDDPVTTLEGQGVLVTEFIEGKQPDNSERTIRKLGELLGRLHALPKAPKAAQRDGAALHLFTVGGSLREELDTAKACLQVLESRCVGGPHESIYMQLLEQLGKADDFSEMPRALVHTDLVRKNLISVRGGDLVVIDWAGTGYGPRIVSLGVLLFYGSLAKGGWAKDRVDAIVGGYRNHIQLDTEELDRLAEAMEHRLLISETYGFAAGLAGRGIPAGRDEWSGNRELCRAISEHARKAFAAS